MVEGLRSLDTPEYMNPGGTVVARAKYLALLERDEEAFAAVEPLLSGRVPCEDSEGTSTHPLNHLACLLPSCLRTGRVEQAREIHRRTWRQLDNDEDLAANLEFCARSGNEERGLRILQRLIDDDEDLESSPEMLCTAAAALMARRMVDLVEAVAAFSALGDRRANHARLDLANAYAHCERWLDAAECVEEVLPALDEREEDLPLATRMRWILAQAYRIGLDRPDEAIRVLDEIPELPGDDQQHAEAAALLAELQQDEGRGPA